MSQQILDQLINISNRSSPDYTNFVQLDLKQHFLPLVGPDKGYSFDNKFVGQRLVSKEKKTPKSKNNPMTNPKLKIEKLGLM